MKTMLVITLTRKRTPPITARETARDTNNNSYDPKPENGNNSHFITSQMFSRNQISSTDGGGVIKVNENKPVFLGEFTYFSSHWSEETGGLFQSVLL